MTDIKEEIAEKSPALAEAEKFASGQNVALDETKAQILVNGDSIIIVIPTDKVSRTFARGLLMEADSFVVKQYFDMSKRKPTIIKP